MAFKTTKNRVSSDEDSDNEEEDELAMIANRINKLMKTDKFIEGKLPVKPSQKKKRRRILEVIDVVSALALGT
jgi:hypothetical protein